VHHRGNRVLPEGSHAVGGVGDGARPGEDVGGRSDDAAADLFGRHVGGCADDRARQGAAGVQGAGDAEVDDAGSVHAHDDVAGLEVAVDDPGFVDRGQSGHRRDREPLQSGALRRPAGRDHFGKCGAVDEFADDVLPVTVRVGGQHAGRTERGDPFGMCQFRGESRAGLGVAAESCVQHLDRDRFAVRALAPVHHTLTALSEQADDAVRADLLGITCTKWLQTVQFILHRHAGPR
jgi:hypothetical protein